MKKTLFILTLLALCPLITLFTPRVISLFRISEGTPSAYMLYGTILLQLLICFWASKSTKKLRPFIAILAFAILGFAAIVTLPNANYHWGLAG